MNHSRSIPGVLNNFLQTYTSRYSDYDGYWLFGVLVDRLTELRVDLLNPKVDESMWPPTGHAVKLAAQKFREQMEKGRVSLSHLQEASLGITKMSKQAQVPVSGKMCTGWAVQFVASVVTAAGKKYRSDLTVFVAPHNAEVEHRSKQRL